jgi:hypothetical protein
MIASSIGNSALLGYTTQASDGTSSSTTSSVGTAAAAAAKAAAQASLLSAAGTFRASTAQHVLDRQQAALATDLRAAMTKAGVKLAGPVEFSLDSTGKLAVKAGVADKAAMSAFLKADTSRPGFSARLTSVTSDADKLSGSVRQSAAISQAARYGGRGAGVMSLYGSLMQQQDTTPAVFSLGAAESSLTYPGAIVLKA